MLTKPEVKIKIKKLSTFAADDSSSSSIDELIASKETPEQQKRAGNEISKEELASDALDSIVWNRKKNEHKRGPSPYLSNVKLIEPAPKQQRKPQ